MALKGNIAYQHEGEIIHDSLLHKFKRVLTSTAMLLAAYMCTQMLVQGYIFLACYVFGYDTTFGYHWVMAKPFGWEYWGNARVIIIYAAPPFLCLVAAYMMQYWIFSQQKSATITRLFWLWLQICMINFFLTQLFIIPVGIKGSLMGLYQTFSIVATWFNVNESIFIPATVLAGALSLVWGILFAPIVHSFSFSSRLLKSHTGKDTILRQVYLFPVLFAAPFIILFSNKYSFLAHLVSVALLMVAYIGTVIRHRTDNNVVLCSKEDVLNKWPWLELLVTAALWAPVIVFFNR